MQKQIQKDRGETVYSLISNIPYIINPYWYEVTERPLYLDLIGPKHRNSNTKRPLILWICGGAFMVEDRSIWIPTLIPYLEIGYSVASVDYRVSSDAPYPAAVQDIKAAIRFLRANSDRYGIDPSRIVVAGESAGGYLALMSGSGESGLDIGDYPSLSSIPDAIVDYYGPADLNLHGNNPNCNQQIALFTPNYSEKRLEECSPIHHIHKGFPPTLIFHGSDDDLVPLKGSQELYEKLQNYDIQSDFFTIVGACHGDDAFYSSSIRKIVCNFLNKIFEK